MPLPINIEDLLNKRKVESNRIEFKAGWNPDKIYHTICAFATDFENIGGGYILVGVEEVDGVAKRPVKGLDEKEIDRILKEMVGFDAKISPAYITKVSPEEVDGKNILAIWVPSGINRPYSVLESVVAKKSVPKYYIRSKSSTIEAKGELLDEVRELANRVPFDERGNASATIDDISSILLYDHLKKVGSKLIDNFAAKSLIDILDEMDLLTGAVENRQIKNCALMMFCEHPEKFFPVTQVDIVIFPEGSIENPDLLIEVPKIVGPIPKIINDTLSYIRTNVIKKRIIKPTDNEKSDKIFNYPYQAFEEAVVNALYHRDYQEREPVEITIEPTHVDILSYAGPDRSISAEAIKAARKLKARRYRNRRLGDFLKELDLTEGRATGIPTIQKALKDNGSMCATIDTDDDRTYFLMTIPCRKGFENDITTKSDISSEWNDRLKQIIGSVSEPVQKALYQSGIMNNGRLLQNLVNIIVKVQDAVNQSLITNKALLLQLLLHLSVKVWIKVKTSDDLWALIIHTIRTLELMNSDLASMSTLLNTLGIIKSYEFRRKIIAPLIDLGYITMTNPDKPRSANQMYRLTDKGICLFES